MKLNACVRRNKISACLFLSLLTFACSKPHDNPDPPPTPPVIDTLGSWVKEGNSLSEHLFDINFVSPQKGFVAGANGIYQSNDSGKTWSISFNSQNYSDLFFLNDQVGFAKGSESMTRYNKLAFTMDGGNTWKERTQATANTFYDLFFVSPAKGFFTALDGLYRTTDTGRTLQKIHSQACNGIYFFNATSGLLYPNSFQKSNDSGNSWQSTGTNLGINNLFASINTLQFTDATHGWMNAENKLWKTNDGWASSSLTQFADLIVDIHFVNNTTGYVAFQTQIFKTTDGGLTWTRSCKIVQDQFLEIFFLNEHYGWACTGQGKVLRLVN